MLSLLNHFGKKWTQGLGFWKVTSKHLCSKVPHPWSPVGLEVTLPTPIPAHATDSPISGADASMLEPREKAGFSLEHLSAYSVLCSNGVFQTKHLKGSRVFDLVSHLFPFSTELCRIPSHLQGSGGIELTQETAPVSSVTRLHSSLGFSPQSSHLYSNNT